MYAVVGRLWALLAGLGFLLALPAFLWHPKLRGHLRARLGGHPRGFFDGLPPGPRVWVHAASAGDVRAIEPVVRALRRRAPDAAILLTAMTNSGLEVARRRAFADRVCAAPADLPGPVRRLLGGFRPRVLLLEYAEIWPVTVREAARAGARVVLSDGRLSEGHLRGYRLMGRVLGDLGPSFALLLMRDEAQAARARALGAPAERIHVTGNTKLDAAAPRPPAERAALRRSWRERLDLRDDEPLLVAGSTHAGLEEETVLAAVASLGVRAVLAPRYVERAAETLRAAAATGLRAARASEGLPPDWQLCVLDSVGELAALWHAADLAFVGGSIAARGGHDPLEPAAAGAPVLIGPDIRNCADLVALLQRAGAARVVESADALAAAARELLADRDAGARALAALEGAGGAAERNAELVVALL